VSEVVKHSSSVNEINESIDDLMVFLRVLICLISDIEEFFSYTYFAACVVHCHLLTK